MEDWKISNIEKALKLIKTFETGDISTAYGLLNEGYIQHNLNYQTGRDGFLSSVKYLASCHIKTTVNNIRAFEDNDKVFLQTVYDFSGNGKQVAFDIFRFDENGQIIEHWDNLTNLAKVNPSNHSQIDGTIEKNNDDRENTRKIVSSFVNDILCNKYPEKLMSYFEGDRYIQHNTLIADGVSGLLSALNELSRQGIEMIYSKTHMVLADSNYALALSEGTFGGVKTSYYDLFRVKNNKICEHWDVIESILEESKWQNKNGKF